MAVGVREDNNILRGDRVGRGLGFIWSKASDIRYLLFIHPLMGLEKPNHTQLAAHPYSFLKQSSNKMYTELK